MNARAREQDCDGLSVVENATTTLRHEIVLGRLAPKQTLTQRVLARSLGISFVPLREALRTLETEGFVIAHHRQTATVSALTHDELDGITSLQVAIIPELAARAGQRTDREELRELSTRLSHCASPDRDPEWCLEQRHRILVDLASANGSPTQSCLLTLLCRALERYLRAGGEDYLRADCAAYDHALADMITAARLGATTATISAARDLARRAGEAARSRAYSWP